MKKLLMVTFSAGLLLSACSFSSDTSNKKEAKFGEMMNNGKRVSFVLKNKDEESTPDKDNPISDYIFTNDGKSTTYHDSNGKYDLGDLKDKSQDEILKIAKKVDKESLEKERKDVLGDARNDRDVQKTNYDESIKNDGKNASTTKQQKGVFEDYDKKYKDLKNLKYTEPKERKLKIGVVEDGTGNGTEKERFYAFPRYVDVDSYEFVTDTKKINHYMFEMEGTHKNITVYDDKYAYLSSSETGDDRYYLATKVSKKSEKSALDKPDSKYVKRED
ncbi:hypothetical protein [Staphylococcus warneri]|uniref:hypothetical protein n=1 Tax=Staphylococcus warneri TaxID=1292 RepID=UPI001FB4CC39|nr:hypothetical protein [Staphylococcus warneri]MCJ1788028.1 hypothetical protein [Staphylococcus warneri]MCJ1792935.1 hypothetical protein [Staphylococcus warneri]MCJ1795423.1 hypothetical protein [Staphylococcus warneri]MCJ1797838.1 hypothetical protein [Staphylococcus warneri]MCJ1800369.1 hypothetical protein [Staphylococcus warneri]